MPKLSLKIFLQSKYQLNSFVQNEIWIKIEIQSMTNLGNSLFFNELKLLFAQRFNNFTVQK